MLPLLLPLLLALALALARLGAARAPRQLRPRQLEQLVAVAPARRLGRGQGWGFGLEEG